MSDTLPISDLDPYKFSRVPITSRFVPAKEGVYFLFENCKMVYIGHSVNLLNRINAHIQTRTVSKDSECAWITDEFVPYPKKLEFYLIRKFTPPINKQGKISSEYSHYLRCSICGKRFSTNVNEVFEYIDEYGVPLTAHKKCVP